MGSRQKLRDSIGSLRLSFLIGGTVSTAAALTLLTLLWVGAAVAQAQGDSGHTWTFAVNHGWAPITVTICAALIRLSISLQAGVTVSMLASILLEERGVNLEDSIFLSLIRAVSVQPVTLLVTGGRGVWRASGLVGFSMTVLTSLLAIFSTFISSALLSDFGNVNIIGGATAATNVFAHDGGGWAAEVFKTASGQSARFAEYTDDIGRVLDDEHVDDTGLTVRAFLPLAASGDRETLRSYTGWATVFDHRVVCVAPELTILSLNNPSGDHYSIRGYMTFDKLPSMLHVDPVLQQKKVFNCVWSKRPGQARMEAQSPGEISVCYFEPFSAKLDMTTWIDESILRAYAYKYHNANFMVVNVTLPFNDTSNFTWPDVYLEHRDENNGTFQLNFTSDNHVMTKDGPWASAKAQNLGPLDGAVFSVTACVTTITGFPFNITATSASDGAEPTPEWSRNSTRVFKYDTTALRRQLNATAPTALSTLDRGIMALDMTATNWTNYPFHEFTPYQDDFNPLFSLHPGMLLPSFSNTSPASPRCIENPSPEPESDLETCEGESTTPGALINAFPTVTNDGATGHPLQLALFYQALVETGSPARAVQAWVTSMTRQRYYDALPRFIKEGEVRYSRSVQVFIPTRWGGFLSVVGLLACHAIATVWVGVWFVKTVRHSMLGNHWQAVAQVVSEVTRPVLERAGSMKDGDVETMIREDGVRARARYGIVRDKGRWELGILR